MSKPAFDARIPIPGGFVTIRVIQVAGPGMDAKPPICCYCLQPIDLDLDPDALVQEDRTDEVDTSIHSACADNRAAEYLPDA